DGTIKYAENPPKRYEDIYPLDLEAPASESLWRELLRVLVFWAQHGVRIFRVDNPHTKPFPLWSWLLDQVWALYPDVIFLSEAFTRPKPMKRLAKLGFSQSYTYFTWRNSKQELADYLAELALGPSRQYFRPNFFVNTPDILPEGLQRGGRPAFPVVGHVQRLRALREPRLALQRGVRRFRKIRVQGLGLEPPWKHQRRHRPRQPDPPPASRPAAHRRPALPPRRQPPDAP